VCHQDLDATIVTAANTTKPEPHVFATNPAADCFYVYPTISADKTPNSDFVPGDGEEISVTKQQAARLSSVCNVYAPIYRQITLTALLNRGTAPGGNSAIAYGDVLNAWNYFLENYSKGRPFVLIGHSQGSFVLRQLIKAQIDNDPALRARLVSAFLIGGNIQVPTGQDVGGDFQNLPLCRDNKQRGCVVAYSTFRASAPPTTGALFGAGSGGNLVACNNPAQLAGGPVVQKPYFATASTIVDLGSVTVTTPYFTLPNYLTGECVVQNGYSFLSLTVSSDPADLRADTIGGDFLPGWGLHIIDVNIAMGDIVNLAGSQIAALADQ